MEEKKRSTYYPESQKKYAQANKEKRYRNQRKSSGKRFINEDATVEELEEILSLVENRLDALKTTAQDCASAEE